MQCTEASSSAPCVSVPTTAKWDVSSLPDVDDVRPKRCRRCRHPARRGGRICLQGHGVRIRRVLVPAALGSGPPELRVTECWGRRYRCVLCGAVQPVLPRGVRPRYLCSIPAIVVAFFLVVVAPVGHGLTHAEMYARQGMYDVNAWRDGGSYRWRSIDRWSAAAMRWWSSPCVGDLPSLLVGYMQRGLGGGLVHAVEAAVSSHVCCGDAM